MEGFNPDQSLIPSVGGSITPMSGGGQIGGEQNNPGTEQYNIVGMDQDRFKSPDIQSILKQLAPTIFTDVTEAGEFWNQNYKEDNLDIKNAIFDTLITNYYDQIMQNMTIETDVKGTIDKSYIIRELSKHAEESNIKLKFTDENIEIELLTTIPNPVAASATATPAAAATPVIGGTYDEDGMYVSDEESEEDPFEDTSSDESSTDNDDSDGPFAKEALEENPFDDDIDNDSDNESFNSDQETELMNLS